MTLSYILEGAGWAQAVIEQDGQRREMRFSWMSDALSRLIEAAIRMAQGARAANFGFTDEPGEHECVVTRTDSDQVVIQVFWYKEWTPPGTDTGDHVFTCTCTVAHFCAEVFRCSKELLDEHGTDGYKDLWMEHQFPDEKFERLSRVLHPPRMPARRQP